MSVLSIGDGGIRKGRVHEVHCATAMEGDWETGRLGDWIWRRGVR